MQQNQGSVGISSRLGFAGSEIADWSRFFLKAWNDTMEQMETDDEILELAISREIEAHDLFLELAERVREPQIQSLLRELAQEELEHKHKLELEIIKSGRVVRDTDRTAVPSRGHILSNTNDTDWI